MGYGVGRRDWLSGYGGAGDLGVPCWLAGRVERGGRRSPRLSMQKEGVEEENKRTKKREERDV